jgi:hypothetical protein
LNTAFEVKFLVTTVKKTDSRLLHDFNSLKASVNKTEFDASSSVLRGGNSSNLASIVRIPILGQDLIVKHRDLILS